MSRRFHSLIWPLLSLLALAAAAPLAAAPGVLTNASLVLASETNFGLPVQIRGVVTAARPAAEWGGRFFVQDNTAGIFVENIGTNQPQIGDYLEITGTSHPGGFAPIVTLPRWTKLGVAPLPPAKPVAIEQLMAGVEDSQRVEITGIVRTFQPTPAGTSIELASGGFRLELTAPALPGLSPEAVVGAHVRVRGTAATFYSGQLRHLITVKLHVPVPEDFVIVSSPPGDPFASPVIPLNRLGQYRYKHPLGERVHVRGMVTLQRPGEDLFIQDQTGGLQVKSRSAQLLRPGDLVEVVGFPGFEQYLPVLQDGIFRKIADGTNEPVANPVSYLELQAGHFHAAMVLLHGRVLETTERSVIHASRALAGQRTVLTVQNAEFVFTVEGPVRQEAEPDISVPIGSFIEVRGVCLAKLAEDGKLLGLQLLLPGPGNLQVLERPSWWTPQHLLMFLAGVCVVLLVAVSWIVMVSRKNAALRWLIVEKEQAQIGLQHANDRLEERVRERSEQLKLQINARKEAEVQFNAVLNERTRLAQELHDTLEQTLTGIALQMDTAARFAGTDTGRAAHHLDLARSLVTQSQTEVRCSVWDLRSRSPEQLDLAGLLRKISQQLTEDTRIKITVQAVGRVRPLPETLEENLLRIAQEALTNIIKHANATQATITLDYGPQNITLTVEDNGTGFDPSQQAGPREGHFGLLGMTERANRLHGRISIHATPGQGTTIQAVIPIPAPLPEIAANNNGGHS